MDSDLNPLYGVLGLILFFLPALVANRRKHHNANPIFLVTVIALCVAVVSLPAGAVLWLVALVWASTSPAPKQ